MIIPVYQPVGSSSHQLAAKIGQLYGQPATHTGTLDPMAEGVVVCLTGDDRLAKIQHSTSKKTYLFTILVGVATDSHDLLGKITDSSTSNLQQIPQLVLQNFLGEFQQTIPEFSARRLGGKSSFDYAKASQPVPPQTNTVTIDDLTFQSYQEISSNELQSYIENKIRKVSGDFRQEECINSWQAFLQQKPKTQNNFSLLTYQTTTSKRTYIRGLVRDISSAMNIPMTTFHIIRTANGPYHIQDCLCLV